MSDRRRWTPPSPAKTPRHLCCWPKCTRAGILELPMCRQHLAVAHDVYSTLYTDPVPSEKPKVENVPAPSGTVYYVQVGAHIKIGWASDLGKRMRSYPPNSHLLAVNPGTRSDEARMHKRFATARTHGREWYAPVPSLLHHIEQMKAQHGLPDVAFGAAPVTVPEPRPSRMLKPRGSVRQIAG